MSQFSEYDTETLKVICAELKAVGNTLALGKMATKPQHADSHYKKEWQRVAPAATHPNSLQKCNYYAHELFKITIEIQKIIDARTAEPPPPFEENEQAKWMEEAFREASPSSSSSAPSAMGQDLSPLERQMRTKLTQKESVDATGIAEWVRATTDGESAGKKEMGASPCFSDLRTLVFFMYDSRS